MITRINIERFYQKIEYESISTTEIYLDEFESEEQQLDQIMGNPIVEDMEEYEDFDSDMMECGWSGPKSGA